MKNDIQMTEGEKKLSEWKPSAVPADMMQRLKAACPVLEEPVPMPVSPGKVRWWMPALAAAAAIVIAVFVGQTPKKQEEGAAVADVPAEAKEFTISSAHKWLESEELATVVSEDGRPYRLVKGKWLNLTQIKSNGGTDVWSASLPREGIACLPMDIY